MKILRPIVAVIIATLYSKSSHSVAFAIDLKTIANEVKD